jgi:hypothetical protein
MKRPERRTVDDKRDRDVIGTADAGEVQEQGA